MLRSVNEVKGYAIKARDGEIGKAHAFLFDDRQWTIRYLVVNTGNWLDQRLVLLVPGALREPDWTAREFPVDLDCEQVRQSPELDMDKPVSRKHEIELHRHYNWAAYWAGQPGIAAVGEPPAVPAAYQNLPSDSTAEEEPSDPHLRSTREVSGYDVFARDNEFGYLDDFIMDDEVWQLRYAVVDTRDWLPGRQVLIAVPWIDRVDWHMARVRVDLTCEQIEGSPEYDPEAPVNREYEERLYDFYGRPRYWG